MTTYEERRIVAARVVDDAVSPPATLNEKPKGAPQFNPSYWEKLAARKKEGK